VSRRRAALVIAAALGILPACSRPAETTAETPVETEGALESQARKLVVLYDKAWMDKDVPALERLIARDYVYISSLGAESDYSKTRETVASPGYRLERGRRGEIRTHKTGTTVLVSTRWYGAGVSDGKPFVDDQRCSVVVGFADGRGRILSEHCTNIPAK
jgi:ketosteroid isomerase-like protein